MRALGLDIGTKTVGLAVSDELGITAQPVRTVRRKGLKVDVEACVAACKELGVEQLIAGLPLNMDGSEGPRALACRRFGDALASAAALPITYWDERLTTVAAERALLEADVSRAKRKEVIDQVAASLILQSWLDSKATRQDY